MKTETFGNWVLRRFGRDPFGIQLQLGRSALALGTFITLLANPAHVLFHSGEYGGALSVNCEGLSAIGAFCRLDVNADVIRLALAVMCLPAMVGLLPAFCGWLHAYAAFSLSNNAIGIEGGDQLTVTLAILLALASATDRRWSGFAEARRGVERASLIPSNVLLAAIVVQVAYVYVEAALVKLGHPIWAEGSALWYWVQNSGFGVAPATERVLLDLLANPLVSASVSWGTIVLELLLAAGLLLAGRSPRVRFIVLLVGIGFHVLIAAVMGLVTFAIAMTGALLLSSWRARDGYPLWLFRWCRNVGRRSPRRSSQTLKGPAYGN